MQTVETATSSPNSTNAVLAAVYPVNTILHTKDGRKVGNAIVIRNDGQFNLVKTDYGNEMRLTNNEISELFYVGYSDMSEEEREYMIACRGEHKHAVK